MKTYLISVQDDLCCISKLKLNLDLKLSKKLKEYLRLYSKVRSLPTHQFWLIQTKRFSLVLTYYRTFSSNMIEIQDGGSKWRPISAIVKNPCTEKFLRFVTAWTLLPSYTVFLSLKMWFYSLLKLSNYEQNFELKIRIKLNWLL